MDQRAKTIKLLEGNRKKSLLHWIWPLFLGYDTAAYFTGCFPPLAYDHYMPIATLRHYDTKKTTGHFQTSSAGGMYCP